MAKSKSRRGKGYLNLGLGKVINLILAFFTVGILGAITRFMRGKVVGGLISLLLFPIFWWIDIFTIAIYGDLTVLA